MKFGENSLGFIYLLRLYKILQILKHSAGQIYSPFSEKLNKYFKIIFPVPTYKN